MKKKLNSVFALPPPLRGGDKGEGWL